MSHDNGLTIDNVICRDNDRKKVRNLVNGLSTFPKATKDYRQEITEFNWLRD